jgi:ATP-dependent DNA helicase RecQ
VRAIGQAYDDKTRLDAERLDRMIIFAQTALCRWRLLLERLDEPPAWDACGVCDNCQGTAHLATGHAAGA